MLKSSLLKSYKYLTLFLLLATSFFVEKSYGQVAVLSCSSGQACNLSVQVCTPDGCTVLPPTALTTGLDLTEIIVSMELTDFNTTVDDTDFNNENFGITFAALPGSSSNIIRCSANDNGCVYGDEGNPTAVAFSTFSIQTAPTGSTNSETSGELQISLTNPETETVSYFLNILGNNNAINIEANYWGSGGIVASTNNLSWQADEGTFVNAPGLSANAGDSLFMATFSPPSDTSSVIQDPPAPATPTSLVAGTGNSITGYLLAYWKDDECSAGGWGFSPNAISYTGTAPTFACTYTPYNESFGFGGTSAALGCNVTGGTFLSATPALTTDTTAVPSSLNTNLSNLINNPGQVQNNIGGSCLSAVYVASPATTFTVTGITNGDVYGATAWGLNAAYPTPGISLAHSNIVYTTGVDFDLASTKKTPGLSTSETDCFVATAASGSPDSQAVFYWRILRDKYLTPLGITPFYYKHAPTWAAWLEEHDYLKKPVNFILEVSGKFFYETGLWVEDSLKYFEIFSQTSSAAVRKTANETLTALDALVFPKAYADENDSESRFGLPKGEFYLLGGVLSPTADKDLYKEFYPRETYFITAGGNSLYWKDALGYSVGIQGRYMTNRQEDSAIALGNQEQAYVRSFYSVTGQLTGGVRYRFFDFPYVEPGLTVAIGGMRFREEATANGTNPQDENGGYLATGVTKWSPVYEGGAFLDVNLTKIFRVNNAEQGHVLKDVMFRAQATYNNNPTDALSSTGFLYSGGFAFLLE